jgi:hypothetical protein
MKVIRYLASVAFVVAVPLLMTACGGGGGY